MTTTDARPRARGRPAGERRAPTSRDPANYFNRELSWLDFNLRVLELAEDAALPLLERTKFASIYTSNLDEFFMVRVAGLHDQIEAGVERPGSTGAPRRRRSRRCTSACSSAAPGSRAASRELLLPALAERGIVVKRVGDVDAERARRRSPSTSAA